MTALCSALRLPNSVAALCVDIDTICAKSLAGGSGGYTGLAAGARAGHAPIMVELRTRWLGTTRDCTHLAHPAPIR